MCSSLYLIDQCLVTTSSPFAQAAMADKFGIDRFAPTDLDLRKDFRIRPAGQGHIRGLYLGSGPVDHHFRARSISRCMCSVEGARYTVPNGKTVAHLAEGLRGGGVRYEA